MENMGDFGASATESIRISQVLPSAPDEAIHIFGPDLTYALYGENEQIFGYKGLSITLRYAADDMTPLLKASWKEKVKEIGDVKADDPIAPLLQHLPKDICRTDDDFKKRLASRKSPFIPPGELLLTYEKNGKTFEVWKSRFTDPVCKALLANFQVLVTLYIEGGEPIPLDEEEWASNRWDVFLVYERTPAPHYIFVGYSTVHQFYFFDKTIPNLSRTRISQFIIIPPYQRNGHGAQLYDEIFNHYASQATVQEITVEDPSDAFDDLRVARDIQRLKKSGVLDNLSIQDVVDGKFDMEKARKENKMPERQFAICMEIALLEMLNVKDKLMESRYRLWVKTRIYKQNKDVLLQLDRMERIEKLDETYHHLIDDYKRRLKAMKSRKADELDEVDNDKPVRPVKRAKVA